MSEKCKIIGVVKKIVIMALLTTIAVRAFSETKIWQLTDSITARLELDTGVLYIVGTGEMPNWSSRSDIPWITDFGYGFSCDVLAVEISEGVTSIGDYAFYDCYCQTVVSIPSTVRRIGSYAFSQSGIESLSIPEGVLTLGERAFYQCDCLQHVDFPSSLSEIGSWAFSSCWSLSSVVMAEGVRDIGPYAFNNCGISSLTLPSSIETIGDSAFLNNELSEIAIPKNVKSIGAGAFSVLSMTVDPENEHYMIFEGVLYDKQKTKIIYVPDGVTSLFVPSTVTSIQGIGLNFSLTEINVDPQNPAYASVDGVLFNKDKSVLIRYPSARKGPYEVPESVVIIEGNAFTLSGVTSLRLPFGLRSIGGNAFNACEELTSIMIPSNVTYIGDNAFSYSGLTSIDIPDGVTHIGSGAFAGCYDLSSVAIPGSVTNIGYDAFECWGMENRILSISLGDGLGRIDDMAFRNAGYLPSVVIPPSVKSIGDYAFSGCTIEHITIPDGVESIGKGAFRFSGNEWEAWEGGVLDSVTIPASVTNIGTSAFFGCPLASITFLGAPPDEVAAVGIYDETVVLYNMMYEDEWSKALANHENKKGILTPEMIRRVIAAPTEVKVTVTNVVVNYVVNSIRPEFAMPPTTDTGFVNVISEVRGSCVAIPSAWAEQYPDFADRFGSDFVKALTMKTGKKDGAGNDLFVWQDYVAGTDPTKDDDVFTASITLVDGKVEVSWSPELDAGRAALRKYTIWGKRSLWDSDWVMVPEGQESSYNFFKVTVEML